MSAETPFKEMPFGFANETEFSSRVRQYVEELKEDSAEVTPEDLNSPDKRLKDSLIRLLKKHEREVATLEERLLDSVTFYDYVLSVYNRIIELEKVGKSRLDIVNTFIDEDEQGILAINGLLEHGIRQRWGYHFIQGFLATRLRNRS
jgi:hypothetical protein